MRKNIDITDRFDSVSETNWKESNWNLPIETRDLKILVMAGVMSAFIPVMGVMLYFAGEESKFYSKMNVFYKPYQTAVVELQKLEYCKEKWCDEKRLLLKNQRDDAWKKICENDIEGRYVQYLVKKDLPFSKCK